ncbi:MAG: anti sigma factor C-terminal domain-containing protein [Lachnospiraceae bacterium]
MTYRELLHLYKQGTLEEETKKEVEKDIERQEAISEYLFEAEDIPELTALSPDSPDADTTGANSPTLTKESSAKESDDSENRFIKTVQRSIRHAFIKMGIIVGAIVLMIVLLVIFVLPHFVSLFYYNPGKVVGSNGCHATNQISLDMSVYTELFVPGYPRNNVTVNSRGYGEYDICIQQTVTRNSLFTNVSGYIRRNNLILYDTNVIKRPADNVFFDTKGTNAISYTTMEADSGKIVFTGAGGTPEYAKEQLHTLQDDTLYLSYITLDELMTYNEFISWFYESDIFYGDLWCSVYAENENGGTVLRNTGFSPLSFSSYDMSYNNEKYPYLNLYDIIAPIHTIDAEIMETHFLSLLKYMQNNEAFMKMMDPNIYIDFDEAIAAVEENGLQINGFVILTNKDTLLELSENTAVSYIYPVPLR